MCKNILDINWKFDFNKYLIGFAGVFIPMRKTIVGEREFLFFLLTPRLGYRGRSLTNAAPSVSVNMAVGESALREWTRLR